MSDPAGKASTEWNPGLYDSKHDFVWKYGSDVVSLLAPQPGERILDVGCGTGHLTAQIAECGALMTGVDSSAEMIAAARKGYPNLRFEIADARKLPFREEFDAVFSNATLHWVLEAEEALRSIGRTLRPGGRFVAELGGKGNIRTMVEAFERALSELGVANSGEIRAWYYPSVSEYATLAEKNGFEVRFATLFDRPTELADGAAGLRNWIKMFCTAYLESVGASRQEQFISRVEDLLRPKLFRDGHWNADYRRLRLVAFKHQP